MLFAGAVLSKRPVQTLRAMPLPAVYHEGAGVLCVARTQWQLFQRRQRSLWPPESPRFLTGRRFFPGNGSVKCNSVLSNVSDTLCGEFRKLETKSEMETPDSA
jgi:hypothetical protein